MINTKVSVKNGIETGNLLYMAITTMVRKVGHSSSGLRMVS